MGFTRHRLDRPRLDRPIDGHSVPIGSGARPDVAFVDGNPLLLSVEGEHVLKNLVLLAATAALALHSLSPRPDATTNHQFSDAHDPAHSTPTQEAA